VTSISLTERVGTLFWASVASGAGVADRAQRLWGATFLPTPLMLRRISNLISCGPEREAIEWHNSTCEHHCD
jgi:hypothetical protein